MNYTSQHAADFTQDNDIHVGENEGLSDRMIK